MGKKSIVKGDEWTEVETKTTVETKWEGKLALYNLFHDSLRFQSVIQPMRYVAYQNAARLFWK